MLKNPRECVEKIRKRGGECGPPVLGGCYSEPEVNELQFLPACQTIYCCSHWSTTRQLYDHKNLNKVSYIGTHLFIIAYVSMGRKRYKTLTCLIFSEVNLQKPDMQVKTIDITAVKLKSILKDLWTPKNDTGKINMKTSNGQ